VNAGRTLSYPISRLNHQRQKQISDAALSSSTCCCDRSCTSNCCCQLFVKHCALWINKLPTVLRQWGLQ